MNGKGATIFLSHSSKDLKKVRWIRNEFEKLGQNPLTFSLKCLDDNDPSTQKELLELLKREIESREWFVFCDSKNADESKYVQIEREYVNSFENKTIFHIDLNKSKHRIIKEVKNICQYIYVFFSHSSEHDDLANKIIDALSKKDIQVWNNNQMPSTWNKDANQRLESILKRKKGASIILFSDKVFQRKMYISTDFLAKKYKGPFIFAIFYIGKLSMDDIACHSFYERLINTFGEDNVTYLTNESTKSDFDMLAKQFTKSLNKHYKKVR